MAVSMLVWGAANAAAETRSLKLYFVHTGEKAEIVFKRNGRYDQAGLKKLNRFLRDWRRNEPTRMDPRLFDLIYSVYRNAGARDYIHVIGGYRSPKTNSMLRSRSKGVAEKSQHMLGKAMDFYIPGVSLKKLRETGMKMQIGGVGYYPRSGSPFVHMDVGNVRHWPKMSRSELLALFPGGKTLHVPSDGKPLPGFQQALASYQARKKSGESAIALVSGGEDKKPATNLLAAFFGGGGADDEEDVSSSEEAPPPVAKPVKAAPPKEEPVVTAARPIIDTNAPAKPIIEIVPPSEANRVEIPAAVEAEEEKTPEAIIAALPARAIPLPQMAPRPSAEVPAVIATASIPPAAARPEEVPFGMAEAAPDELRGGQAEQAAPETVPFATATAAPSDLAAGQVADAPEPAPAETAVAANVPIPSWRPDQPAAEPADVATAAVAPLTEEDKSLLMAMASPEPLPSARAASAVAIPTARPTAEDEVPLAALPETAPAPALAPTEMDVEQKAAVDAEIKANDKRVVALASAEAASPKLALAASAPGVDPATVISGGVKTTTKSARAKAPAGKRAPRSVVLAPAPDAARWVLSKDYVAKATNATKAPSFAYNVVVSAPREVYTAGFQKGDLGQANRFTGKAVKFLSVARFE